MAYADVTVLVDGELENDETFFDETLMREFFAEIESDAEGHGYPTAIYVVYHDHNHRECECVQYLTDHKPAFTFNSKD